MHIDLRGALGSTSNPDSRREPPFRRGVDQGPRAPKHANHTETFIAERFQEGGEFSLERTEAFLAKLRVERGHLASDARETAISERMQRDVHSYAKATRDGYRQSDLVENPALQGYDAYVLPTAEAVAEAIRSGRPEEEISGLAQDFVRGYMPYYAATTLRTPWNHDPQVGGILLHAVLPYRVKKHDEKAREASNLVVEEEHREALCACLEREVPVGHYLSPDELTTLKARGFDLSLLSPGVSAFWHRTTPEQVDARRAATAPDFPRPDETLVYEAPRYRSDVSTKLTASFIRDGQVHRLKIKIGDEVHGDLLASRLREYMGFHQDRMEHRDEIKLQLGKASYERFERELTLKYGLRDLRRVVVRRGVDPKTGAEWVVLKDSLIELRPADEIRATALDTGVYDGPNRRELRARFLLRAFLGLTDSFPINHRMILKETETGEYVPEYRFQDIGRSLGVGPVLRRPNDLLTFPMVGNKIEAYDRAFVRKDRQGNVSVTYNDHYWTARNQEDATYADLKWMARVVASLPDECLTRSIRESGIPEELVSVYRHRITRMRNRLVKAFDLDENEHNIPGKPPIRTIELPALESIDEGEAVKKGKIVATSFPGKMIYPTLQPTYFTFLNDKLSLAAGQKFNRDLEGRFGTRLTGGGGPLFSTEQTLGTTLLDDVVPASLGKLSLPVLGLSASRVVSPNTYLFSAEGKGRPYVVRDALSFSLGASLERATPVLRLFGAEVSPRLSLLRKTIEHVHFSEGVASGYRSRPRLQRVLRAQDLDRLGAMELEPGEVARSGWSVGLNAAGTLKWDPSIPFSGPKPPVLTNQLSGALGVVKSWETTYAKDFWGGLHLILETDAERVASLGVDAMRVNLFALNGALLGGSAKATSTEQTYYDFEVVPPARDMENASKALSHLEPEALVGALEKVRARPERFLEPAAAADLGVGLELRYHVRAKSSTRAYRAQALFALNADRTEERVDFKVQTPKLEYDFLRLTRQKRALQGFESLAVDFGSKNLLVTGGTSKKLSLEMDRANPRNFFVMVDVFDYQRKMDRPAVSKLIDELNQRYSRDASTPFFRTDLPETPIPYRKVYANGRIYVSGRKLLELVEGMTPEAFERRLQSAHAETSSTRGSGTKVGAWLDTVDRALILRQTIDQGRALARAARALRTSPGEGAEAQKVQDDLATSAFGLVYSLYKSKLGVSLLKHLLGDEGLLVQGEIFGIHRQTNILQEDMWKNTLRFMGQHWGRFVKVPPISHYVRYEQSTPANAHAPPRVPIDRFLGSVVTGRPGNMVGFGMR